jgi:hypothetical protein
VAIFKTLPTGKFTQDELKNFIEGLMRCKHPVRTPAVKHIENIMQRRLSAIVPMPSGSGISMTLRQIVDDIWNEDGYNTRDEYVPDWATIENARNSDILAKEIWELEGKPVPTMAEFRSWGRIEGRFSKEKEGLTCFYCDHQCVLIKRINGPFYYGYNSDDLRDNLGKARLDCKLIKVQAESNLHKIHEDLVIECPKKPDPKFLNDLKALSILHVLILVCPPEAVQVLSDTFPNYRIRPAPLIGRQEIMQIFEQRLLDLKMPVSPLSMPALVLMMRASSNNIGGFLDLVSRVLEEEDNAIETIPSEHVVQHLRGRLDTEFAFRLVLSGLKGQRSPTEIARQAGLLCGSVLSPKDASAMIRSILGIADDNDPRVKRTTNGIKFLLDGDEPLLGPGIDDAM